MKVNSSTLNPEPERSSMLDFIPSVPAVEDAELQQKVIAHLNDLTKPQGSLGRLEDIALQYCMCRGRADASIDKMKVFTFAGDHGITEERITPFPGEVTQQMVNNMAGGGAAVSVMCRNANIDYAVVDIGVNADFNGAPGIISRKAGRGTNNFSKEPAMSSGDCVRAVEVGMALGADAQADLVGAGEMGIGNTSAASALYSMLLDCDPRDTVGPGTGSTGELLEKKKRVVVSGVEKHKQEWDGTPFDALRRVGGYEIAGITGLIFGCLSKKVPVVVDGFISCAAALVAMRMDPKVRDYLFFAHASAETFHTAYLEKEHIRPILSLDLRLGEGTGAVLAMQIIKQATACYNEMATFSAAGVSRKIT